MVGDHKLETVVLKIREFLEINVYRYQLDVVEKGCLKINLISFTQEMKIKFASSPRSAESDHACSNETRAPSNTTS